ncbi:MAG: hypothetical protein IAF08_08535 [Rhizobacter sp.]|nr:hypothetical protein [Chlorobiales bacterium]
MTRILNIALILFAVLTAVAIQGCRTADDPVGPDPGPGDNETVTTVRLTLTNSANPADIRVATWQDVNVDGTPDSATTLTLQQGQTYTGTIKLLDKTRTPEVDQTAEVEEESDAHQFFYDVTGAAQPRITFTKTDADGNAPPLPVGIAYSVTVTAGAAETGSLRVRLCHYDGVPKTAAPITDTDIDITLPVSIAP